ncbi:MAG TPA: sodium:solute symporter [Terriglobia bacterium]|nr:sodium:solute symporter [Terriglobia bacterium]
MALRPLDLAVVVAYLLGITLFGARFRKGQRTLSDYLLGGRRLPWWALALSVVSAETSILTIISIPGIAYSSNFGFLQLVFGYLLARVVVSFVLIPRYFTGEIFTAYQFIERRFGPRLKQFTAALFLSTRALAEGVRVFAIAIVLQVVSHTGVLTAVVVITLLTLFYTFEGGLAAVIWTDVLQLAIYLAGTAVAVWVAVHAIPGGWHSMQAVARDSGDKFRVFDFHVNFHEPYLFWSGLIGGTFLTSASHGTDQLIVQRLLAARNKRQSQAALLSSGVVILGQFALFLLAGVALFAYYRQFPPAAPFTRPDQIFPTFVVTRLPMGLGGLLTAAILGAGMANLSAALNALASSSVVDFYKPFLHPGADERHYLMASRVVTLAWGAVLLAIALAAARLHESVLELALTIASVPYGSMLGIFLLGALTRRTTPAAAFLGALTGLAVLVAVILWTSVAWTWYVVIGTVVTFGAAWGLSRLQNPVNAAPGPAAR